MFLHEKFMNVKPGSYTEREDIISNLNNVLSTKRGIGSFLRTFGLTETGHHTSTDMVDAITRELKENILLYEPRVKLLEIDELFDEDTGRTTLSVQLEIRTDGSALHFSMDNKLKKLQLSPEEVGDDELD